MTTSRTSKSPVSVESVIGDDFLTVGVYPKNRTARQQRHLRPTETGYDLAMPPAELVLSIEAAMYSIMPLYRTLRLQLPQIAFVRPKEIFPHVARFIVETSSDPIILFSITHPTSSSEITLLHETGHIYLESVLGCERDMADEEELVESFAQIYRFDPVNALQKLRSTVQA